MANYTPPAVTRQSLLQDYMNTLNNWQSDYKSNSNASAMSNFNRMGKLRDLMSMVDSGDSYSSEWVNPFGSGGSGGAPSMATDNRFSTGLSDAESRLRSLLDNPDSIQQSGAYKFRVKQGEDALQRQMGAKGLLNSGNRLMELTKYGQDMASQEYDAQYGRLGNLLSNYSTGYAADRNANTNQFAAQSNAWNQAQANRDRVDIANKDIWSKRNPVSVPGSNGNSFKWV